ncbi:SGNH/GDSL hydrolase family protein [Bordetella muralis]|uniref:SGNH/GDSL hydrolase family protein n=1 Tax=Bordetella muralis TaxID=1649130 RepID=UPI0039EE51B5
MAAISKEELNGASFDAGTLKKYANDPAGVPNVNRVGNDVSNLATLKAEVRDAALMEAGVTPYELAVDIPASGNAPGSRARVWGDTTENNGYYTADSTGVYTRDDPQPANQGDIDELQVTIATTLGLSVDSADYIKVVTGPDKRIYVWLDHGLIEAMGLGPRLTSETQRIAVDRMSQYIGIDEDTGSAARIVQGKNGRVYLWIDDGLIDAAGFGPRLTKAIQDTAQVNNASSVPTVLTRDLPLRTDGSSLRRWHAKLGQILAGSGQARLGMTGDSWTEFLTILEALCPALYEKFGRAGTGWISFTPSYYMDGVTGSRSAGWTLYDPTQEPFDPPPMPTGPDGFVLYSSTAGDSYDLGNLVHGDSLTVFFAAQSGSFRWQANDGAWTTVTPDTGGSPVQSAVIPLTSGNADAVRIETVSGTVGLTGFLLRDSAAVGIEVLKLGQGGATGYDFMQFAEWIRYYATALDLDLVVTILGTNDPVRPRASIATFEQAHEAIIAAYRTAHSDCGNVIVMPMQRSTGAILIPQSQYRSAAYNVALANATEWVNGYDAWASHAVENARGQWADGAHVSNAGAQRFVHQSLFPVLGV